MAKHGKSETRSGRRWKMAVLALALIATPTLPASACINVVESEFDKDLQVVKAAEQHVTNGKLLLAAINVTRTIPQVRSRRAPRGGNFDRLSTARELTLSAVRTMAMVTVRTGGAWIYKKKGTYVLAVPDEKSRTENLEWAVESLRLGWTSQLPSDEFDAPAPKPPSEGPAVPENPRDASNLAEALALIPAHQPEARKILEGLAAKDLITSGYAYAALARLRTAAGDGPGAQSALNQCAALSGTRAQFVCVRDEPKPKVDATLDAGKSTPQS